MEPVTVVGPKLISLKEVRSSAKIRKLIDGANDVMKSMGYTEHGQRHVGVVSSITRYIMEHQNHFPRVRSNSDKSPPTCTTSGPRNVISRINHPSHGAAMAFTLLNEMGMDAAEIAPILGAIGNHEEMAGGPVSVMSAALIIADKSDVHFSRVQNPILESFDIHDRVNYAVQKSRVEIKPESQTIELTLEIDTKQATVMEYFEIFLSRMVMCRKSAEMLGNRFTLNINGLYLE